MHSALRLFVETQGCYGHPDADTFFDSLKHGEPRLAFSEVSDMVLLFPDVVYVLVEDEEGAASNDWELYHFFYSAVDELEISLISRSSPEHPRLVELGLMIQHADDAPKFIVPLHARS